MGRTWKRALGVVVLGIALGSASGCDRGNSEDDGNDDDVLAGVDISLIEALGIGGDAVPGGIVLEGELELDDEPVYDVDLLDDGEVREVFIDASTGDVTGILSEPEDLVEATAAAAALASAEVSLEDAIDIAEMAGDGVAVAIDFGGDFQLYQVVIIQDNDAVFVTVDLDTGDPVVDDMPPPEDD